MPFETYQLRRLKKVLKPTGAFADAGNHKRMKAILQIVMLTQHVGKATLQRHPGILQLSHKETLQHP